MKLLLDESLPRRLKNLTNVEIAVVVLLAPTNRFHDLKPLAPRILEALREARPGSVIHVGD